MKGAVSAQKAFQGFKTETRELLKGTKVFPDIGSSMFPPSKLMIFFTKRKLKKVSSDQT